MSTQVHVIGSGVTGLVCAYYLSQQGAKVSLSTASDGPDASCCSWWAGGMLAPFCEQESAEPLVGELGLEGMAFWRSLAGNANNPEPSFKVHDNGTLVVSPARDQALLKQFKKLTDRHQTVDAEQLSQLEPDLAHFKSALWFEEEAHLTPRSALSALWQGLEEMGVMLHTSTHYSGEQMAELASQTDWLIDCRGLAAQDTLEDLRGVKGEMLHIHCREVNLSRPIRFLHPRHPLYIVPRENNEFMIGATMIEANNSKRVSVRSALELLSAAYALQPAFAEAEIIEIGVDSRPAFDDNLPKIRRYSNTIFVNGLFRHGYLLSPALAKRVSDIIFNGQVCPEVVDAYFPEWQSDSNRSNYA